MAEANEMLSQEEIDSLVKGSVSRKAPAHSMTTAPPPRVQTFSAQPPAAESQPVSTAPQPIRPVKAVPQGADHEECIAAGEIQALGAQLADLRLRLSKLEAAFAKGGMKSSGPDAVQQAQNKAVMAQVNTIASQVEIISEGLRGTAGYNINKTFKCSSCNTVGIVAVKVKCNQCGQENWWGWWPKKK